MSQHRTSEEEERKVQSFQFISTMYLLVAHMFIAGVKCHKVASLWKLTINNLQEHEKTINQTCRTGLGQSRMKHWPLAPKNYFTIEIFSKSPTTPSKIRGPATATQTRIWTTWDYALKIYRVLASKIWLAKVIDMGHVASSQFAFENNRSIRSYQHSNGCCSSCGPCRSFCINLKSSKKCIKLCAKDS